MSVKIYVDTACDIAPRALAEQNVELIPLQVFFGEEPFTSLRPDDFYEKLASAPELPKTAQIPPITFEEIMRTCRDNGDEAVFLPLSRELSGTYHAALIAKDGFPGQPFYVVDTRSVTFALALLVYEAVRLRDAGMSAAAIAQSLEEATDRVCLYAVIDDLKYLRMGGRLSSAGAVVGSLLGIKPLVSLVDGKVECIGKARGLKAAYQDIAQRTAVEADRSLPCHFGHSHAPERMAELQAIVAEQSALPTIRTFDIGPIVGTHAGPGCTGIAFFRKA